MSGHLFWYLLKSFYTLHNLESSYRTLLSLLFNWRTWISCPLRREPWEEGQGPDRSVGVCALLPFFVKTVGTIRSDVVEVSTLAYKEMTFLESGDLKTKPTVIRLSLQRLCWMITPLVTDWYISGRPCWDSSLDRDPILHPRLEPKNQVGKKRPRSLVLDRGDKSPFLDYFNSRNTVCTVCDPYYVTKRVRWISKSPRLRDSGTLKPLRYLIVPWPKALLIFISYTKRDG